MATSDLHFLSSYIGGPGQFQGYRQLIGQFEGKAGCRVVVPRADLGERLLGKLYSIRRGWRHRNQRHAAAEFRFSMLLRRRRRGGAAHVLVAEYHLPFLDRWKEAPKDLIATLHFPPSQWTPDMLGHLGRLASAIVLYRRDIGFFERHVGKGRVRFARHGVRTDFFTPGEPPAPTRPRLAFVGHYLRNTEMLSRVVRRLYSAHPRLRFDFLVPEGFRYGRGLKEISDHPAVEFHAGLDDGQLCEMYRGAYLCLVPMSDSGANNAVLESMACGTPVVTTDIGGIGDYGGGSVFPLAPNDDDDAMVALVGRYLNDPSWRNAVGAESRSFAEEHLAWPVVAREHERAYSELAE